MIVPAIGKKSEELTAAEREERYGIRSLADLRTDMNALWTWRAVALGEKDRMQEALLALEGEYNWALGFSLTALVGCFSLFAWIVWG